jgi:hypothetical protein
MDVSPTIIAALKAKGENKGEADEFKCKKELYEKKMDTAYCIALFGEKAKEGIEIINPINGRPYEHISEIPRKTKGSSKSDITVMLKHTQDLLHISVKSLRGQMPSILNHTPRSANVFQSGPLKDYLNNLDLLANEYHAKRTEKTIAEDVKLCKLSSFANELIKKSILKMLVYFIFDGTGFKEADPKCNAILIMNKDDSKTYIPCATDEEKEAYVNTIIDGCVLSYRNKGMRKKSLEQDLPWVCKYAEKDCGAIHIRLSHK